MSLLESLQNYKYQLSQMPADITVAQLLEQLQRDSDELEAERQKSYEEVSAQITGKCFRIKFSESHEVLLYIKSTEPYDHSYGGDLDCLIIGEKIVLFENTLEFRVIEEADTELWERYDPNISCREYDVEKFDLIKKNIRNSFDILSK